MSAKLSSDVVVEPGSRYALNLAAGDALTVTQIEGGQAVDLIAVAADSPRDYLSMWMSCCVNRTWKLTERHVLVSHAGRRMFTITADTCGENYSGGGYCNSALNKWWHGTPEDHTCENNIKAGLDDLGLSSVGLTGDACLNLFMKVDYQPDGAWVISESPARKGDSVRLNAQMAVAVVISNCPATRSKTNSGLTRPIRVSVAARGSA